MAAIPPVISMPAVVAPVQGPTLVTSVPPVPTAVASIPPVLATIVFALISGPLHANDIVDLNSKVGRGLYNKATLAISIPFDGNSKNINL